MQTYSIALRFSGLRVWNSSMCPLMEYTNQCQSQRNLFERLVVRNMNPVQIECVSSLILNNGYY